MDGGIDILEMAPDMGSDTLLMQSVVTQVKQSQLVTATQRLLCHAFNHIFTHLQPLHQTEDTNRWAGLINSLKVTSSLAEYSCEF